VHLRDQTKQTADRHKPPTRTEHRTSRLPETHARPVAARFGGDRTTGAAVPVILA
jgi:hypothetical protein